MPRGSVSIPLKRKKLVNSSNGNGVSCANPHLRPARTVHRLVGDRGAARGHYVCAGNDLRVYLKRLREIAGPERRGNFSHVLSDRADAARIGAAVAVQHDPSTIGQVLEDVG